MARPGEATEAQRAAFAHVLAGHLDKPHAAAQLAERLGVNRNAVYQWKDGKREPSRTDVWRLERALDLPPGALSGLLGYLPSGGVAPDPSAPPVEAAIDADSRLSPAAKRLLKAAYRSAVDDL